MPTWQDLCHKAANDSSFRSLLLKDPKAVAAEAGIDVPAGINVQAICVGNTLCRDSNTESYPGYTGGFISTVVVTTDHVVSSTTTV